MRKTLFLCLILILGACSQDEPDFILEISDSTLIFSSFESCNALGVKTNSYWEIFGQIPNWCSIDKLSGKGIATISIQVLANESSQKRSFELTLKTENQSIPFFIEQSANSEEDLLIISPSEFSVPPLGEEIILSIEANNDWEIINIPIWCNISKENGEAGKNDIKIIVEPNSLDKERDAEISVKSGTIIKKVKIHQEEFLPDNIINLKEAGALQSELERRNINSPTDLVIYGKMNGDDFETIRKLKGLLSIDISKVEILESVSRVEYSSGSEISYIWYTCKANTIPRGAFFNVKSIKSIKLPPQISDIEEEAFYGCSDLETITIPETIKVLSRNLFYRCSSLKSIAFPSKLVTIGEGAFAGCSNLANIEFHSNIREILSSAFANCTSLTSVIIPDYITKLEGAVFIYCTSLKTVKISNSIKSLYSTFWGCESLEDVDLPQYLESIEDQTFHECKSLKSIKFPKTVSRFGALIFYGCSSLKEIYLLNPNPPTIGTWYPQTTFHGFESTLCNLYIPNGSRSAYVSSSWSYYFKNYIEF